MEQTAISIHIHNWISKICETEHPDDSIIAYHFGLFESDKGYTIYLAGSAEFDEDDSDWACNSDFEPEEKYLLLPDEFQNQSWEEVLDKAVASLTAYTTTATFQSSFLATVTAITTGFDDGDLVRIK